MKERLHSALIPMERKKNRSYIERGESRGHQKKKVSQEETAPLENDPEVRACLEYQQHNLEKDKRHRRGEEGPLIEIYGENHHRQDGGGVIFPEPKGKQKKGELDSLVLP